jgi:hypothetical protein
MRVTGLPMLVLGVAAAVVVVCCDDQTCEVEGGKGEWGEYTTANLPKGKCTGLTSCVLHTQDSCPQGGAGPHIDWECSCNRGEWVCRELERSKTVCLP